MISFNAISCNTVCAQMVKLSLFGSLKAVAKRLFFCIFCICLVPLNANITHFETTVTVQFFSYCTGLNCVDQEVLCRIWCNLGTPHVQY